MYKVLKNSEGKFDVIELATENLMGTYDTHKEAKDKYNQYKGGKGFNGWTPSFFVIDFKVNDD